MFWVCLSMAFVRCSAILLWAFLTTFRHGKMLNERNVWLLPSISAQCWSFKWKWGLGWGYKYLIIDALYNASVGRYHRVVRKENEVRGSLIWKRWSYEYLCRWRHLICRTPPVKMEGIISIVSICYIHEWVSKMTQDSRSVCKNQLYSWSWTIQK